MRKKFLRTFVAVVLICSMLVTPAYAESAKVTGSDVNIRSGPGINYPVVACLSKGAAITVTDSSNSDWYAVNYNGLTGFMSSRYIKIDTSGSTQTVIGNENGANAYINAMYVRFRSGPSSNSTVLGEYNTGKEVTVIGTSGSWTQCIINGQTGYVYSSYVTRKGEQPPVREDESFESSSGTIIIPQTTPAATPAPAATPVPTPESSSNVGIIIIPGNGSSNKEEVKPAEPSPTPVVSPAPTAAPVVTPAATAAPVITPPPAATPAVTAAPKPTATPVPTAAPSGGNSGGIIIIPGGGKEETEPAQPSPTPTPAATPTPVTTPAISLTPSEEQSGYINGDYVRFRTGPSTSYSIIATYNRGKELTALGTSGDWTKCRIGDEEGYVFTQYVALTTNDKVEDEKEDDKQEDAPPVVTTPVINNTVSTPAKPGYITGNNVRFRSAPSSSSQILGELFYGNNVTITGKSGDWTAITYNNKNGYVFSQYVMEGEYSYVSSGGSSKLGREIADYALQFVGYNYTWGGKDPSTGFDCSGLMYYVYKQFGYTLNRVAADQARNGVHVEPSDLQPGDILCFYSSGSYIGHVGMYIGDNKFVHAANSATGVVITELSGYYASRGYEARRII